MNIVFFSDPHGFHDEMTLQEADIAICCGDISMRGLRTEVVSFMEWFMKQPVKHRVMIAGNHDYALEEEKKWLQFPENIIYLEHNSVVIEGIKIWGSPAIDGFGWAFDKTEVERDDIYYTIPCDCDIIVSHVPPYGIMDKISMINRHVGCKYLKQRIDSIKPKYVIFGHVHERAGILEKNEITYINTACAYRVIDY